LASDLRVAQLLEGVHEQQLGRRLLRQAGDVGVVLAPEVTVDFQESREQVV
jgi:hypothetical protein